MKTTITLFNKLSINNLCVDKNGEQKTVYTNSREGSAKEGDSLQKYEKFKAERNYQDDAALQVLANDISDPCGDV
jgi:hypothetical protein